MVIYQQEGTEAGASGDDLGAPFSLPVLSKSALTHQPQAGGGMACGHRAPSGGGSAGGTLPLPVYTSRRQQRLVHRTQPRRSPGAWGSSDTNKLHQVYTGALLATTICIYNWG